MLRRKSHHSPHLQNAWNKYGENYFEFFILERTRPEDIFDVEQAWLNTATCAYNVVRTIGKQPKDLNLNQKARISASKKRWAQNNPDKVLEVVRKMNTPEAHANGKISKRNYHRRYEAFGKLWTLTELAETYGVDYQLLKCRHANGWDLERAVTTPVTSTLKTRTHMLFGRLWTLTELAKEYGVRKGLIKDRLRMGWDLERAATTPARGIKRE
jgi:hypothetical protein